MNPKKILVVDDEKDYLAIASAILKKEGFEVVCAEDGERALEKAGDEAPFLVLLDIGLPGMDGMEVQKRLARNPKTRGIKIIFFTVYADVEHLRRAMEGEDCHYIVKPFDPDELVAKIRTCARGE